MGYTKARKMTMATAIAADPLSASFIDLTATCKKTTTTTKKR